MQPPLVKSRILVVDDINKNLQIVGTVLRNQGYEVMPAASGAEALKCVRAQLPDLILLDLMMPEMDGLEVCRRLKADPATRQVPVIFLTASNEMEHLVKGFEMGAVDYVSKSEHLNSLEERHSSTTQYPRCGGSLVQRVAKKGASAGTEFLGCSKFPQCRYTVWPK